MIVRYLSSNRFIYCAALSPEDLVVNN